MGDIGETPQPEKEYTEADWKRFIVYLGKLKDTGLSNEVYAEVHVKAQAKIDDIRAKQYCRPNRTKTEGGNL